MPDKDFMGNDVLSEILGNLLFTTLENSQWFFSKATDFLVCLKWTGYSKARGLTKDLVEWNIFLKKNCNYKKGKEILDYKTFLQFISYY